MPCPVCQGPHIRWLLDKMEAEHLAVVCSADGCDVEIQSGWLVYAQLQSSKLPELDEAVLLCCDDHAELEAETLKQDGHPTVCLPFLIQDAQEAV
jgi:hypothetical protein